jgi:O-antigen biosynthesis rhamnosyltransferase
MKVLHFYKTSFPDSMGGVERVIDQLARGTNQLGVCTEVLSTARNPKPSVMQMNGYVVHRAKLNVQLASTSMSMQAVRLFSELARSADLVHYHFPWPFMDLVHFAAKVDKPTVLTYHSDIVRQKTLLRLYRPLQRKFLGSVGHIVATSPNYLSTSDVLSRYKSKVTVIPIGLDKHSYPIASPQNLSLWRERFGSRFFLFVGVFRYYKGLHLLLDAARGADYAIVIAGVGPTEAELRAHAQRLRLRNVHFVGYLADADKVALLTLCHGVIFPSNLRSEAFGISLLEGAMYGKPMISSEIGTGTSFINVSDETGLVVPPHDPDALRTAMDYLWNHPDIAAAMGSRAEERYWCHFTAGQMSRSYVNLYERLIAQYRQSSASEVSLDNRQAS